MNSPVSDFGNTAKRLSRNPLGIIALFIVLVYGIAGLVMAFSTKYLLPSERLPLVWFLVIFPILVLFAFYWLVSRHHTKLYAPQDYFDKEGFFRAQTTAEKKARLDQETRSIEQDVTDTEEGKKQPIKAQQDSILGELSVRHAYVLAEELAIREIEGELNVSIHRQVAIGRDYSVDGVFGHKGRPKVIEVKYARRLASLKKIIQNEIARFNKICQAIRPSPSFILAIVIEDISEDQQRKENERLGKLWSVSDFPIEFRIYNFTKLRQKYGI